MKAHLRGATMAWNGDARNRLAKSLITLIDQVDQKFPSRDRHNDETIGDLAHQQRDSDHNPHIRDGAMGVVTALDITHDPAVGFDAQVFADSLRAAKDPRIKYVIFNGRIFSSTESPWVWQARNRGSGDHSEHVHVSVVGDRERYDDTQQWPFDLSGAESGRTTVSRPKLKLGDSGPSVIDLQNLLGISPSGMFGDETDQAVRSFQASHNLVVDGIVGSHTWGVLSESPIRVAGGRNVGASVGGSIGSLSPALIDQIVKLAGASELARVDWEDRGVAPRGYIKGMAVTFGQVYAKWKAGDSATRVMAAANSGNDFSDALSWYDSRFRAASMSNAAAGATTLRHLFVLLIGLGMRESSGLYWEGRDKKADNLTSDKAEAGLFQMSWNARFASPELPKLFAAYSAKPEGILPIFQEGAGSPTASALENFGTGEGVAFQRLCKSCPAFAVEAAAVGLRVVRRHWGPINDHEAEIRPEADRLLQQVQNVVDTAVIVPDHPPRKIPWDTRVPSPAGNPLLLLILVLVMLSKEKPMADDSAKPGQGVDHFKLLLPMLLQSALTGKQIDIAQLLTALLTGQSPASASTPGQQPASQQQTDPIALLLPLLIERLTGKTWLGMTPPTPTYGQSASQQQTDLITLLLPLLFERLTGKPLSDVTQSAYNKPVETTTTTEPMIQKPSVQLSAAGLALSSILQAIGTVGTPFGLGTEPTTAGTLATLVPILTGVFGATGGFSSLQNFARSRSTPK
jgi:peptidoglycan hydrolase-like protein with peptidoglycan-binding domain